MLDGPNYSGFKDRFYLVKDGRITLAYLDGSGWFDVFKDTHQVGHFQFCPDDPTLATFCHEGPWNLVTQRIWLLDLVSREAQALLPPERTWIRSGMSSGRRMASFSLMTAAPGMMARSPRTAPRL